MTRLNGVILNYNDAETVLSLLEQIGGYEAMKEIVVVDNCSTDDSWERLKAVAGGKIQVIRSKRNGGYGAGNNEGVRYASEHNGATHVLIANPDVSFDETCLQHMMGVFGKCPDTAAVSAVMCDKQYGTQRNGWPLRGFWGELTAMGPISRRLFGRMINYPESRFAGKEASYVDVVHGSMLMVDTGKFLDAGGYDEGIFLYQEEAALGQRLRAAGYRTVLLLNCSYNHSHSVSVSKTFQSQMERQRLREESAFYYMKRYLSVNRVQELFARLWFFVIRMEIWAAQIGSIRNKASHRQR